MSDKIIKFPTGETEEIDETPVYAHIEMAGEKISVGFNGDVVRLLGLLDVLRTEILNSAQPHDLGPPQ